MGLKAVGWAGGGDTWSHTWVRERVRDSQDSSTMEDIFHWIREGNTIQVRMWLDDTEHDMNQG